MPAAKSSSRSSKGTSARKASTAGARKPVRSGKSAGGRTATKASVSDGLTNLSEQLVDRVLKPLDLVMLSRERIQDTLDEAAIRGRVTHSDANELVSELVSRGRQQTDDLLVEFERLLERGRTQLESATRRARQAEPLDRIMRGAQRARRTVGPEPALPIPAYDDLSAVQVQERIRGLRAAELRRVRDYERRHANRKSVLRAVEKALA